MYIFFLENSKKMYLYRGEKQFINKMEQFCTHKTQMSDFNNVIVKCLS